MSAKKTALTDNKQVHPTIEGHNIILDILRNPMSTTAEEYLENNSGSPANPEADYITKVNAREYARLYHQEKLSTDVPEVSDEELERNEAIANLQLKAFESTVDENTELHETIAAQKVEIESLRNSMTRIIQIRNESHSDNVGKIADIWKVAVEALTPKTKEPNQPARDESDLEMD